MGFRENTVKRIMLLSHELGTELSQNDVLNRAEQIRIHLQNIEKVANPDLDYALVYWREILEKRHDDGRSKS